MKLLTALATPFRAGRLDLNSFARLLENQHGAEVLCCGTTGEGALLSECEKKLLIKVAKSVFSGKIWAGVGATATSEAVKEAVAAQNAGACGLLIAPPSFVKCTQKGFVRHVLEIKQATDLPIMLYNAPSRCGYNLWQNALAELAQNGVTLLKDAGSDIDYARAAREQLTVLCGNEEKLHEFAQIGCQGVVSVVSNLDVGLVQRAWNDSKLQKIGRATSGKKRVDEGQTDTSSRTIEPTTGSASAQNGEDLVQKGDNIQQNASKFDKRTDFAELAKLCFCQINPIPVKYMLYKMGIFDSYEVRLPLTEADKATQAACDSFLERHFTGAMRPNTGVLQ